MLFAEGSLCINSNQPNELAVGFGVLMLMTFVLTYVTGVECDFKRKLQQFLQGECADTKQHADTKVKKKFIHSAAKQNN